MLGTCVVLLDDIGQKANPTLALQLFGEPSYKIQTSPGSQQWGYLLERLATNDEIAPIHSRLMALAFTDKNGLSAVRNARLPAGINNKPEYGEAERDGLDTRARAHDRAIDEPVRVAVVGLVRVLMLMLVWLNRL